MGREITFTVFQNLSYSLRVKTENGNNMNIVVTIER